MKIFVSFALSFMMVSSVLADDMLVQFEGPIEQGSLVRGKAPAGSTLILDGANVKAVMKFTGGKFPSSMVGIHASIVFQFPLVNAKM